MKINNYHEAENSIPKELLFGFFMRSDFLAPLAILLKLDFSSYEFLVFAGPIVDSLALGTG
jgi:hypothetical protein